MSESTRFVRAASLAEVRSAGVVVARLEGHAIALFFHEGTVHAVDNRCPHMGFPLHKGSVDCGILTCHWHHARFDLSSGGTFDPWADDIRAYGVRVDGDDVLVDLAPPATPAIERYRKRLADGLRQNLRLVIAKAAIGLDEAGAPEEIPLTVGARYAVESSRNGWGAALTILTAMANLLPALDPEDRPRALYHGLTRVAAESAGQPPAVLPEPLPTTERRPEVFVRWFRQFVEVRDRDGAERALRTAAAVGLPKEALAEMLFTALTDHRYIDVGHPLDFANKAFELLERIGWEHAEVVLPALVPRMVSAGRMEESSAWRHPIDLAGMLEAAFDELPALVEQGRGGAWSDEAGLVEALLADDPAGSIAALKAALAAGAPFDALAGAVCLAAARRIARFHTANEFGDWDTTLHTFTFANAVHQAMKRSPSVALLRGVFDAAVSVYLDRFLNMPAAPLPRPVKESEVAPDALLTLLDRQQSVDAVGAAVSDWLSGGRSDTELMAVLGGALLREDADFHTYQVVEAGFRQYADRAGTEEGRLFLIAVGRYLAAHCPTPRAMGQTYRFARRLHRGEAVYEE